MSVVNPLNFDFNSNYEIDKIIGTFTDTLNISAPTSGGGTTTLLDTKAHNFGDSCYFEGIFTTNSGVTWNSFGSQTPNLSVSEEPVFQTLDVEAYSDATNVYIWLANYYNNVSSVGTAYTVTYKIYLLAKNTMASAINPSPNVINQYFNSNYNYQKIAFKGTTSISVSAGNTGSSSTITHNLGYVPKIRAFFSTASPNNVFSLNQPAVPVVSGYPQTVPAVEAHLTSTTLVFYSDQSNFAAPGISGNVEYRIYYDD